jgi:hypothetical protein
MLNLDSRMWKMGCRASEELHICVGIFINTNVTHAFAPQPPKEFWASLWHIPSSSDRKTSLSTLTNHPLYLPPVSFRIFRLFFFIMGSFQKYCYHSCLTHSYHVPKLFYRLPLTPPTPPVGCLYVLPFLVNSGYTVSDRYSFLKPPSTVYLFKLI